MNYVLHSQNRESNNIIYQQKRQSNNNNNNWLRKQHHRQKIKYGQPPTVDDLKLQNNNGNEISYPINTASFSWRSFWWNSVKKNVRRYIIQKRNMKSTVTFHLIIRNISVEKGYKYLGILQHLENMKAEVKSRFVKLNDIAKCLH